MDLTLNRMVQFFKAVLNIDDETIKIVEKQVSYLHYAFYDMLENYTEEKIDLLSLIIYFAYLFGNIIEDDNTFKIFIAMLKAVYDAKRIKNASS